MDRVQRWFMFCWSCSGLVLNSLVLLCNGCITSRYVRILKGTVILPRDSDVPSNLLTYLLLMPPLQNSNKLFRTKHRTRTTEHKIWLSDTRPLGNSFVKLESGTRRIMFIGKKNVIYFCISTFYYNNPVKAFHKMWKTWLRIETIGKCVVYREQK